MSLSMAITKVIGSYLNDACRQYKPRQLPAPRRRPRRMTLRIPVVPPPRLLGARGREGLLLRVVVGRRSQLLQQGVPRRRHDGRRAHRIAAPLQRTERLSRGCMWSGSGEGTRGPGGGRRGGHGTRHNAAAVIPATEHNANEKIQGNAGASMTLF